MDTPYGEITTATTDIIYHCMHIEVNCLSNGVVLECHDKGGMNLEIRRKITVEDKYKPHGGRAPNGQYWKFDCTFIQKFIYENCWEGDDGSGTECTIWDRVFFKKCYDTSASSLKAYSALTMTSAMIAVYLTLQ